jgi:sirohydrochlorin cobaltochelatase
MSPRPSLRPSVTTIPRHPVPPMPAPFATPLRRAAALLALGAAGAAPLAAQGHAHGTQHAAPAATATPATTAAAKRAALPPRAANAVVGTVIIAHGGGPDWNAQVEAMAAGVKTGGPVAVSYLMGPGAKANAFQDAVRKVVEQGATEVAVVPLLVSSHSGHYDQIRYLVGQVDSLSETMMHHLHMSGITRPDVQVPLRLTRAVDESPDAARVLAERAKAIVPDAAERGRRALFLLGHGPNAAEDYAAWMENLREVADTVKAVTGFRSVLVELVRDDAPAPVRAEAVKRTRELIALQHELTGQDVAVVPILVSTGSVSKEKFPKDLVGLPVIYRGEALLPHPEMARWVEARVREAK